MRTVSGRQKGQEIGTFLNPETDWRGGAFIRFRYRGRQYSRYIGNLLITVGC